MGGKENGNYQIVELAHKFKDFVGKGLFCCGQGHKSGEHGNLFVGRVICWWARSLADSR